MASRGLGPLLLLSCLALACGDDDDASGTGGDAGGGAGAPGLSGSSGQAGAGGDPLAPGGSGGSSGSSGSSGRAGSGAGGAGAGGGAGTSGASGQAGAAGQGDDLCASVCARTAAVTTALGCPEADCEKGCAQTLSFVDSRGCLAPYTALAQCSIAEPDSSYECTKTGVHTKAGTCQTENDAFAACMNE